MGEFSAAQCRSARATLDWSQDELEGKSGVSRKTIADFERGIRQPYGRTLDALQTAFEAAGIDFIPENGGGAGVRLKERSK